MANYWTVVLCGLLLGATAAQVSGVTMLRK